MDPVENIYKKFPARIFVISQKIIFPVPMTVCHFKWKFKLKEV